MAAEVAGHVHHLTDEIQVWLLQHRHGFGGELACIHTPQGNLCRAVALGSRRLDRPMAEDIGNLLNIAVLVALQGTGPALQFVEGLGKPFWQVLGQVVCNG